MGKVGGVHSRGALLAAVGLVIVAGACSDDGPTSNRSSDLDSVPGGSALIPVTATEDPSPVPTVPGSTLPGQVGGSGGVIDAVPTIVATTLAPFDPDDPPATSAPPTTAFIGDPQPLPGTTAVPLPPTIAPPAPLCDRLNDDGIGELFADAVAPLGGGPVVVESTSDTACQYSAGSVVAEFSVISLESLRNDWFKRTGIEPVGEVGGDAVGLGHFIALEGTTAAGYTVAIAGGREGIIVAVGASSDARVIAARLAAIAAQTV